MRILVGFSALALIASPAMAQQPQPQPSAPESNSDFEMPAELLDPAMGEILGQMLGALTRTMMDLPIGEVQAAVEGREPTSADKRRTVRDLAGNDPQFDRKIEQQMAAAVPRMQATMKVMAKSMPAMIARMEKAADEIERQIDRSTANLPQPGYPKH